jgi:SAM-dependent methyltransferase
LPDTGVNTRKASVARAYSAAAEHPGARHPFPVGRGFALSLGYPESYLNRLHPPSIEAFTGVSDLSIWAHLTDGTTVLDLGCGAGLDSLIAAERVGERGLVVGIDFSAAMLERAREAVAAMKVSNVNLCRADAEALPIRTGSIDAALVNGIFNLNPGREKIFAELARVMKPGGTVWAAELIIREALPSAVQADEKNWFA